MVTLIKILVTLLYVNSIIIYNKLTKCYNYKEQVIQIKN